jgi:hypothetical protein
LKLRGFLGIKVRDLQGHVIRKIMIPNTVCRGARVAFQALSLQINANEGLYNKVWSIWAGTDATPPVNTQTTLVSVAGDWFRKIVDPAVTVYNVGGIEGTFSVQMTMEAGDGVVGNQYCECGLFTRGNNAVPAAVTPGVGATEAKMIARQIHPIIEKDATISIEYTWRFEFSI